MHKNIRITKKIFVIVLLFVVISFLPNNFVFANQTASLNLSVISNVLDEIRDLIGSFLRGHETVLKKEEIIFWTNEERKKEGLGILEEDLDLDLVAEIRLKDMEEKQYFDHYSPEGRGISDEAEDFGYRFITIGENLAEGDFKDSEDLVRAWMESQGHRENILKDQYKNIGIAAKKIVFEGKKSWLIVQAFSRPLSECVEPKITLKNSIDLERKLLTDLFEKTNATFSRMTNAKNNGDTKTYNNLVSEYNSLVSQVNEKTSSLQNKISEYNREVSAFNLCLEI